MKRLFGVCCLGVIACGGQDPLPPVKEEFFGGQHPASTAVRPGEVHPPALVAINVGTDQTVEFYNLGDGVLTVERGPASAAASVLAPALEAVDPEHKAGHLAELFAALRPDLPVPEVLREIDARAQSGTPTTDPTASAEGLPNPTFGSGLDATVAVPGVHAESVDSPGVHVESPQGCNNGCCDPDWLNSTDALCASADSTGWHGSYSWHWNIFNAGYSWATSGSAIDGVVATVCSASGTSSWYFDNQGGSHTYNVSEAHYMRAWFSCTYPWLCTSTAYSSVNSSTNQHLHAHCGIFDY